MCHGERGMDTDTSVAAQPYGTLILMLTDSESCLAIASLSAVIKAIIAVVLSQCVIEGVGRKVLTVVDMMEESLTGN